MRGLKFDPFVFAVTVVAAPQHRQDIFAFHCQTKFSGFTQEIALVEVASEREAHGLKPLFKRNSNLKMISIVSQSDIFIDQGPYHRAKDAQRAIFA